MLLLIVSCKQNCKKCVKIENLFQKTLTLLISYGILLHVVQMFKTKYTLPTPLFLLLFSHTVVGFSLRSLPHPTTAAARMRYSVLTTFSRRKLLHLFLPLLSHFQCLFLRTKRFWHTLGDARLLSVQRDRSTEDPKIVEGSCEKYESACCVGFAE